MENAGRGKFFKDLEKGFNKFVFNKNEPRTCNSCKEELSSSGWYCEECNKIFCYDCINDNLKRCSCFLNYYEHIYYKCEIIKSSEVA